MTKPLVSVLIPVYNAGEFLRPSVESILAQTYANLEVFVIDDGSTDECIASIADIEDDRIRLLHQANAGKSVALNRALELAQGEFYAIHDADDISYPSRIEKQVACMCEQPEVAAVFTGYDLLVGNRRLAPRFRTRSVEECRREVERMGMPSHDPTVMFRMSMVEGMRYDPDLRVGQGWDYILRVGERYAVMVCGECLYSYRVHLGSNTRRDVKRRHDKQREVLRRASARRGLDTEASLRRVPAPACRAIHREAEHGLVPHFIESVLDLRQAGRWRESLGTAWVCSRLHALDPYYYKPLVYCIAPISLIAWYRAMKAGRHGQ